MEVRRPPLPGELSFIGFAGFSIPLVNSPTCLRHAPEGNGQKETVMLGTVLLIILILMLLGAFPTWPHSRSWGYGPSGGLGLIVLILVILLFMGRI